MASLTIRNIPDDAKLRFRQRAAGHGRSMEEEARIVLIAAANESVTSELRKSIGEMLFDMSRPGLDLPIPKRSRARIPDYGEE